MRCRNTLCEPREMDLAVRDSQNERYRSSRNSLEWTELLGAERAHPLRCPRTCGLRVDRGRRPANGTRIHARHQLQRDVHLFGFSTPDKSRPASKGFLSIVRRDPHESPIESQFFGSSRGAAFGQWDGLRVRDSEQELRVTRWRNFHRRLREMGIEYETESKAQRRSYREVRLRSTVQSFYAVCGSPTGWRSSARRIREQPSAIH